MKCFMLSLHRSATSSATVLLERFGIRTIRWPGRLNGLSLSEKIVSHEDDLDFVFQIVQPAFAGYQAASDIPLPVLYRQLARNYPQAKWFLFQRRAKDWIKSVRQHIGERELHAFERVQYWHYFPARPTRLADLTDTELALMYEQHTARIEEFAAQNHRGKLGVFELANSDSANALARFLGIQGQYSMPHLSNPLRLKWPIRRARMMVKVKQSIRLIDRPPSSGPGGMLVRSWPFC